MDNMYGNSIGLFNKKTTQKYLPHYVQDLFDVLAWIKISGLMQKIKKGPSARQKAIKCIRIHFINKKRTHITKLLKFINTHPMELLAELVNIDRDVFKNQLTLFIYTAMNLYQIHSDFSAEQLMHCALFDSSTHDDCKQIKTLIDVAWACQPEETYAETVAKICGFVLGDDTTRLLFDKFELKVLCAMLMPHDVDSRENILKDLLLQCRLDGKRACKVDERSKTGSVTFDNIEAKHKYNDLPYRHD